jgi:succinylglutamate desuccinylase
MNTGFENFDPVKKGQVLAVDKNGPIRAVESGLILMPLYQKLGDDGFFLGREVADFWIRLSGILRRMKVGNLMPILPGVSRSTTDPDIFEIDTRIARFFPLQIFHLLGFRKRRKVGEKLIVSRRKFDTVSPFARR